MKNGPYAFAFCSEAAAALQAGGAGKTAHFLATRAPAGRFPDMTGPLRTSALLLLTVSLGGCADALQSPARVPTFDPLVTTDEYCESRGFPQGTFAHSRCTEGWAPLQRFP